MAIRYLNAISTDDDVVRLLLAQDPAGHAAQFDLDAAEARRLGSSLLFAADASERGRQPVDHEHRTLTMYDGEDVVFEIQADAKVGAGMPDLQSLAEALRARTVDWREVAGMAGYGGGQPHERRETALYITITPILDNADERTLASTPTRDGSPSGSSRTMQQLQAKLIEYLRGRTGKNELDASTTLFDDGTIDSVGMIDLIVFVENETDCEIRQQDVTLENFDSVARIVAFVASRCSPGWS